MKSLFVIAAAFALSAECNPVVPNPDPTPWPVPDPTEAPPAPSPAPVPTPAPTPPVPSTGDTCDKAEENAASQGCPLKGSGLSSWSDVCRNAAANAVTMHQKCIASAKSCPEITACLKSTR
jgi:hypothetical protein